MRRTLIVLAVVAAGLFLVAGPAIAEYPPTVRPTTVRPDPDDTVTPPGGVAFTGGSGVARGVVVAGTLLFVGTGLLYLTRRRAVQRDA